MKIAVVQNVLARAWGSNRGNSSGVRITVVQPLRVGGEVKDHLLRCMLETSTGTLLESGAAFPARDVSGFAGLAAGQALPSTVIVKCLGERSFGTPFRLDDLRPITEPWGLPTPAWAFFNEWAATTFLSSLSNLPPQAPHLALGDYPRCWGADSQEGIVVLEDLGSAGVSLLELLMRSSSHDNGSSSDVSSTGRVARDVAEAALLSLAERYGQMHALTCGKEREYEQHWSRLAHGRPCGGSGAARKAQAGELRRQWRQLKDVIGKRMGRDALPSALPGGSAAAAEIEAVAAMLEEPGPFLSLTHGENHPQNTHVLPAPATGASSQQNAQTQQTQQTQTALIDFEFAEYRHALMDGMFTRHLFPWRVYRLPEALQANLERAYREALVQGCPEAADDSRYVPAVVKARAAWMVFNLTAYLTQENDSENGPSNTSIWERDGPGQGGDFLAEGITAVPARVPSVRQRVLLLLEDFARDSFAATATPATPVARMTRRPGLPEGLPSTEHLGGAAGRALAACLGRGSVRPVTVPGVLALTIKTP